MQKISVLAFALAVSVSNLNAETSFFDQVKSSGRPDVSISMPADSNGNYITPSSGVTDNLSYGAESKTAELMQSSFNLETTDYAVVSFSAATLGITLPISISSNVYLTFTADLQAYSRFSVYAHIYMTATALANSFIFFGMPLDQSGNMIFGSPFNITASAATGSFCFSKSTLKNTQMPDNFLSGFFSNSIYASPNSSLSTNGLSLLDGNMSLVTSSFSGSPYMLFTSPKVMFGFLNLSTSSSTFYLDSLTLYARKK